MGKPEEHENNHEKMTMVNLPRFKDFLSEKIITFAGSPTHSNNSCGANHQLM